MRSLFNPESLVWKPLGFLGDLVVLSLLWTVCSLPVLTLGAASAAVYDAAVHGMRRKDEPLPTRFLLTLRQELRQGALSTLELLGIAAGAGLLLVLAAAYVPAVGEHWPLAVMAGVVFGFFLLCVVCWAWPALSRFSMGLSALHSAALRLSLGHILRSAAMALLWGAALWAGLRWVLPMFVCPGLAAYLCTYLIEPVFRQYEKTE